MLNITPNFSDQNDPRRALMMGENLLPKEGASLALGRLGLDDYIEGTGKVSLDMVSDRLIDKNGRPHMDRRLRGYDTVVNIPNICTFLHEENLRTIVETFSGVKPIPGNRLAKEPSTSYPNFNPVKWNVEKLLIAMGFDRVLDFQCGIQYRNGRFTLFNNGNNTYLNGQRLDHEEERILNHGDTLSIQLASDYCKLFGLEDRVHYGVKITGPARKAPLAETMVSQGETMLHVPGQHRRPSDVYFNPTPPKKERELEPVA